MSAAAVELGPLEPEFASGAYDQTVILVWRGAPTRAALSRSFEAFHACASHISGPFTYLSVTEETSGPPSPGDLPFISQVLDRAEGLVAVAVTLEGRHPWLSGALDAAAQIRAGVGRAQPTKFCVEVDEAISWLVARGVHRSPAPVFRKGIRNAIEQIRRRLDEPLG